MHNSTSLDKCKTLTQTPIALSLSCWGALPVKAKMIAGERLDFRNLVT